MSGEDPGPGWMRDTAPAGGSEAGTPAATASRASSGPPGASVFDAAAERYADRRELGAGGMGRVVDAVDRTLDRPVAIKYSLAEDPVDVARFEREVRITARLQHPGIVPIHDAGRDDAGQPYYVMRRIDGEPLGTRVTAAKTVAARLALVPALLGAIDAAAYAHAQGVVHRDIKPWNILLGPFGEALLIDWGLARELTADEPEPAPAGPAASDADAALTRLGSAYGTPGFMSPEQARGEPVDRRTDVYSLGATLYYVLAGALPAGAERPTEAIDRTAAGRGLDLAALPADVPAELIAITAKAVAPAAADRYADAGELAADLRRFLAGQLVAAHRYSAPARLARWLRHRLVAVVAVAAVVVIAAVIALAFRRVVAERDTARAARRLAEARAEELLVDRARAMLVVDPTTAVALLRGLPATSPAWPVAREVVRAAVAAGVERAVPVGARVDAAAFSPAGRLATSDGARIRIHDLAHGTADVVAAHHAAQLAWLDDRRLGFAGYPDGSADPAARQAGIVDTETGGVRIVAAAGVDRVVVAGGRIVVLDQTAALVAYDIDGTAHPLITAGALTVATNGTDVVGRDATGVTIWDRDLAPVRRLALTGRLWELAITPAGDRLAGRYDDVLIEWRTADGVELGRWPVPAGTRTMHLYRGGELVAWTTAGVFSPAATAAAPRGTPLAIAPFDGGAVLATVEGGLALADALGTIELVHRAGELTCVAIDRTGRTLVTGTRTGEVRILPLAAVRPAVVPAAGSAVLLAADGDLILLGNDGPPPADPGVGPTSGPLVLVDATAGTRTELGVTAAVPQGWIAGDRIAAALTGPGRTTELGVFDRTGRDLVRIPDVMWAAAGPGLAGAGAGDSATTTSVFVGTGTGMIHEVPLDPPGAARVIGRRAVIGPQPTAAGLVLAARAGGADPTAIAYHLIDATGEHRLALPAMQLARVIGRTAAGAWWVIEANDRLWRVARDGTGTVVIPTGIRIAIARGDELWAIGDGVACVVAADGSIVRRIATPGEVRGVTADAFVLVAPDGVRLAAPGADVHRRLALPRPIAGVAASRDGRTVAALTSAPGAPGRRVLAVWRDPVPLDPRALPAALPTLTNARLELGSDAVGWDTGPRPATP